MVASGDYQSYSPSRNETFEMNSSATAQNIHMVRTYSTAGAILEHNDVYRFSGNQHSLCL